MGDYIGVKRGGGTRVMQGLYYGSFPKFGILLSPHKKDYSIVGSI